MSRNEHTHKLIRAIEERIVGTYLVGDKLLTQEEYDALPFLRGMGAKVERTGAYNDASVIRLNVPNTRGAEVYALKLEDY